MKIVMHKMKKHTEADAWISEQYDKTLTVNTMTINKTKLKENAFRQIGKARHNNQKIHLI
jgi:hypothetical protein